MAGSNGANTFQITATDGIGINAPLATNPTLASLNTRYFVRLERLTATLVRMSIFTGGFDVTPFGSPLTATMPSGITGLRFVSSANNTFAGSGRVLTGILDNLVITNACCNFEIDALIQALGDNGCFSSIFFDDFATSANWVQTGTQVTIAGGEIQGWGPDAGNQRLTHDLVTPLSDKGWKAEFEFEFSSFFNPAHDIFVLTDTNSTSSALQDHIVCRFGFSGGLIQFGLLHGGNSQIGSGTILGVTASINTRYFVRLQRITSDIARLTVFTGGFDSVLFGTIDVDLTLFGGTPTGLRFVQSQTSDLGGAGRTLTGVLDNLIISEGCPSFTVDAVIKLTGEVLCGTGGPQTIFTEDFTTNAGWTYTGSFPSKLFVDGISFPDVLRLECFRSTAVDGSQHIEKSMGITFNQGNFQSGDIIWEFDHLHIAPCAGFASTNSMFALTANSSHIGNTRTTQANLTYNATAVTVGNPGMSMGEHIWKCSSKSNTPRFI